MTVSDSELIDLLKGNKTQRNNALEAIYRSNRDRVCGFVISNKGTETEATDLFQTVMVTLYENVKKGTVKEDSAISNFLFSLAKFKWLKELGSDPEMTDSQEEAIRTGIDPQLIGEPEFPMNEDQRDQAREVMSLLGFDCKYILIESIYHNTPMNDMATEGNFMNEQIVQNKKYMCLKKLRDLMIARPELLKNNKTNE